MRICVRFILKLTCAELTCNPKGEALKLVIAAAQVKRQRL